MPVNYWTMKGEDGSLTLRGNRGLLIEDYEAAKMAFGDDQDIFPVHIEASDEASYDGKFYYCESLWKFGGVIYSIYTSKLKSVKICRGHVRDNTLRKKEKGPMLAGSDAE